MTLDDLPQLREKMEEFERVGTELCDLVDQYETHSVNPLTMHQVAHLVAGVEAIRQALQQE